MFTLSMFKGPEGQCPLSGWVSTSMFGQNCLREESGREAAGDWRKGSQGGQKTKSQAGRVDE